MADTPRSGKQNVSADYERQVVGDYLARAIKEFDSNRLSMQLMGRLAEETPQYFLSEALKHLSSEEASNALRHLALLVLRQEDTIRWLTDPVRSQRDKSINLVKRFLQIDPSFDVQLAKKLPDRRESNTAEALDAVRSTRALDILDATSQGRRLLPILGHLVDHSDRRISAKATLFVGRRVQNPSWTKQQLLSQVDQRVRANAVEALWGLSQPSAEQIFEDCVSDRDNRVAGNALLGLHLLGRGEAQERILDFSTAEKFQLRSTGAWLLGQMPGQKSVECLTRLVKDEHPQVRNRALRSLIEIRRNGAKAPEVAESEVKTADVTPVAGEAPAAEPRIAVRLDGFAFNVR